jgi:hypothetical protein
MRELANMPDTNPKWILLVCARGCRSCWACMRLPVAAGLPAS